MALFGMSGAGKTTLATAITRHPDMQEAFSEGIVWVDAKRDVAPTLLQERLVGQLTGEVVSFSTVEAGRHRLAELLAGRAVLLVVDDVWDIDILRALNVVGARGALLFTTRDRGIARADGATMHEVDQLTLEQALMLLGRWTDTAFDRLPPVADALCLRVGNLALGVALLGGMIKARGGRPQVWQDVSDLLEGADIQAIADAYGPDGYQHASVLASITLSVDDLSPADQDRYRELAVFAGRGSVPLNAVSALWAPAGDAVEDAERRLARLVDRCLVQRDTREWYTLHDLEFDVAAHQLSASPGGVMDTHGRFIDSYRSQILQVTDPGGGKRDPVPWASAPDDGYLFQNLASHLAHAGRHEQLDELLMSFAWMERKLSVAGISDLLADYSYQEHRSTPVETAHGALQLSAHTLAHEPGLLAGQLVGRLLGNPEPKICALLDMAYPSDEHLWLCPRTPGSLTEPGGPLERILQGHDERINAVAVSADGKHIVSGSRDKTVRIWDLKSGQLKRVIEDHEQEVKSLALTADGQRVVSGSFDGAVRVWNLASGRLEHTLQGHSGYIYAVAVTADSQRIIVGSGDQNVQVWNLASKRLECTLQGHNNHVNAVAVSADGRYVVSGGFDRTVRVWDLASGDLKHTLPGHIRDIEAVAVSADGRYVVSGSRDRTVRVWDLDDEASGRILHGHTGSVHAVAVTAEGKQIVSAGDDQIVRVWDLASGRLERELQGHASHVYAVAVSADGRHVVSGSHDKTVRVWDLASGDLQRPLRGQVGSTNAVAITTDGQRVVFAGYDQPVGIWHLASGDLQRPLRGQVGSTNAVAITTDSRRIVSAGYDQPVGVWDLSSGEPLYSLEGHIGLVYAVAVTADSKHIVTGSSDGTVRVWDLDSGHLERILKHHDSEVYAVAVTADSRRIVSAGYDRIVRVWDLNSGQLECALHGHDSRIDAVAVADGSRYIVSAGQDQTVRVWNLDSKRLVHTLRGHTGWVRTVATTVNGRHVISGSSDRTLRLWDLESGVELARWVTDTTTVTACVGHPGDPTAIVYGDDSGHVVVLSLREPCPSH
ncbi:NB-ARC domain-containing protein [Nocardia sp. NPDC049707]|uniref:NB-ARC domain-containing protein n=1 Tax=Nocardia sp. NPDC049707 TaxID=3154735 RepID=UPI003440ADE5